MVVLANVNPDGRILAENVFVSDFGVRHWFPKYMQTGQATRIPGTRPYVAPEIWKYGADLLTAASDIWAVGCMGYEFFTGRLLFESEEAVDSYVQSSNLDATATTFLQSNPDVFHILSGCLAIDPRQRWSVWQLLDQIGRLRQQYQ